VIASNLPKTKAAIAAVKQVIYHASALMENAEAAWASVVVQASVEVVQALALALEEEVGEALSAIDAARSATLLATARTVVKAAVAMVVVVVVVVMVDEAVVLQVARLATPAEATVTCPEIALKVRSATTVDRLDI